MASPLLWKAFEIQHYCFCYMYPNPVYVNYKDHVLVKRKLLSFRHLPWLFIALVVNTIGDVLPLLYIFICELFFTPREAILKYFIYFGLLLGVIVASASNTIPIFHADYVPGMNQLLQWGKRLQQDYPELDKKIHLAEEGHVDTLGRVLCFIMLSMGPILPTIPIGGVLLGFDQFDYVIEDMLPHPTERETVEHILLPFLVRVIAVALSIYEGGRAITFIFLTTALYVQTENNGLRVIAQISSPKEFFSRYNELRVIESVLGKLSSQLGAVLVITGHLAIVVFLWLSINGLKIGLSIFMYVIPPLALILIAFTFMMFAESVTTHELSTKLLSNCKIGVVHRSTHRSKGGLSLRIDVEMRRVGWSQQPIVMKMGSLPIKRGFECEFLNLLMDNLTNAVFLIPA